MSVSTLSRHGTPDIFFAGLVPAVILVHLFSTPYTKVEESFNIQATHDVLAHGVRGFFFPSESGALQLKDQYDHLTFTGPVPRTFVGALALAGASWPFTKAIEDTASQQIIVRAILGLWNASCLLYYRNSVAEAFGRSTANWFVLFLASGFHIMYYASRTLPNFYAFGLVTIALAKLLPRLQSTSRARSSDLRVSLSLLTATGIIFRSELALLLIPHTLLILLGGQLSLSSIIKLGLLGSLIGLLTTVSIDSLFWQRFPLWPELSGFSYNILHSQSSNWGTSPWHFYFTSALPRLLFNPLIALLCIPLCLTQPALRRRAANILLPNIAFVTLYSLQPHKEWRFIVYVVPPFLTVAATGASWIWTRRSKTLVYRLLSFALIASTLASFIASTCMLAISRLNYPGAEALNRLHALAPLHLPPDTQPPIVHVHMDTLSCMTGITRFLQLPPPSPLLPPPAAGAAPSTHSVGTAKPVTSSNIFYVYDKSENGTLLLDPLFWERFDWVLAESVERVIGRWVIVETIDAYAGVRIVRPDEGSSTGGDVEGGQGKERRRGIGEIWGMLKGGDWRGVLEVVERYGRLATGGWWVQVVMEPKIRIMRREKRIVGQVMSGDW
ncbi:MAG: hypothetical protein Q9184_002279 [Pyrenodesmia sp. 2 TL-2023]